MSKDSKTERDVVKEGELVKRQIQTSEAVVSSKYKYEFTKPVEYHIPGFTLIDTLPSVTEYYLPDFYYINRLLGLFLQDIKSDSIVKRLTNFTDFSFALYVNYALFYVLLKKCYALRRQNDEMRQAIETFEVAGFDQVILPDILLPWVTGIGRYILPDRSRTLEPRLPEIVGAGQAFLCYFLSERSSQLLPNFRAMLVKCRLLCKRGLIGAIADRNITHYRNIGLLAGQAIMPPPLVRANDHWLPGSTYLLTEHNDLELIRLATLAMESVYPNNLSRYLQLHIDLLTHVIRAVVPAIEIGPHFKVSTSTSVGGSSQIVSAHERSDLSENVPVVPEGQAPVLRVRPIDICYLQLHAHQYIIDGDVYNNTTTPQVRVIPNEFQLFQVEDNIPPTETEWFREQKKFQSNPFTFEEATANFRMKRLD